MAINRMGAKSIAETGVILPAYLLGLTFAYICGSPRQPRGKEVLHSTQLVRCELQYISFALLLMQKCNFRPYLLVNCAYWQLPAN